jgi:hypothetical protein
MRSAGGNHFVTGSQGGFFYYYSANATSFSSRLRTMAQQSPNVAIRSVDRLDENVFMMGDESNDIYYYDVTNENTGVVAGGAATLLLSNAPARITPLACLNSSCKLFFF